MSQDGFKTFQFKSKNFLFKDLIIIKIIKF